MAAVLLGVLTDIGGSFAAGFLVVIAFGITLGLQGIRPEEIERIVTEFDPWSWPMIASYTVGCVFSGLGGFVCARVARHSELKLAGIVATVGVLFGWSMGSEAMPLALHLVLTVLSVGAVLLGAWLGAARR